LLVPIDVFGKMQLIAWLAFLHFPLYLVGATIILFRRHRGMAWTCAVLAVLLLLAAADAFLIEPHWLEVTRHTLPAPRLQAPLRIAILADIQTDDPGGYEEKAFNLIAAEKPDLILFVGDYLQIYDADRYAQARDKLNEIMRKANLTAPLGMFAVAGNIDPPGRWQQIFAGLPVTPLEQTTETDLGPVVLTALSLKDSREPAITISGSDKFHIVLGHVPNFSLSNVNADLLIAGHTHGGQVRLPFIGPLMSLSQVPSPWAAGLTTLAPGKHLLVSRGIGLERGHAPRLRFLCRPQIVIINLVPE
jgi:hypothetical protein